MPEQQENQTEVFHLKAPFKPTGDQPQAIEALVQGLKAGDKGQTLLGVTGSGKTFTMANIIAQCNRPTLILEPNKTLASQICTEMRGFFPDDAVEYFVSYYDYYQPEAYIPSTDTYIEKDSAINDEIDRLRHSATAALSEQRNVIIVASVSCIYSLGDPIDYRSMVISLRPGMQMERDELCRRLVKLQYERNDMNFIRNKFRVHGDIVDIHLAYNDEYAIRVEFFGDEIDRISEFDPLTGERKILCAMWPFSPPATISSALKNERRSRQDPDRDGTAGAGLYCRGQTAGSPAHPAAHPVRYGDATGSWHVQGHRELLCRAVRPCPWLHPHHAAGLLPQRFYPDGG